MFTKKFESGLALHAQTQLFCSPIVVNLTPSFVNNEHYKKYSRNDNTCLDDNYDKSNSK